MSGALFLTPRHIVTVRDMPCNQLAATVSLRFNVVVRKQRPKPFAEVLTEVLADVRSRPAEPERIAVGVGRDGVLTDDDGCRFEVVDGSLELVAARQLVAIADRVVLDECGCRGGCGFIHLSKEQITAHAATWHRGARKRKQAHWPSISQWRSNDGKTLIMISDPYSSGTGPG